MGPETQSRCIIDFILSDATDHQILSKSQYKTAVNYLSLQLAIRDRERLIEVLCHHQPDLVTSSIRELVTAYEPVIRALHKAVDLNAGVADLQAFLDDLIKVSKIDPKIPESDLPTVEDFCRLLQKHQGSSHRFIHQAIKNGKEISDWYHEYSNHAAAQYKQFNEAKFENTSNTAAGDFTASLDTLMSNLSEEDRRDVIMELDHHEEFLSSLTRRSKENMDRIVRSFLGQQPCKSQSGPGMFLWRWKQFINDTLVTPIASTDSLKLGKNDGDVREKAGSADADQQSPDHPSWIVNKSDLDPPNTIKTICLLKPGFIELLQEARSTKKG